MKIHLHPFVAAICAAASLSAADAAAVNARPEILTDTRTVVISDGVVVESSGGPIPEALIAQADPEKKKHEIRVYSSASSASLKNLGDLDALMSSAMSEAFATASHGPLIKAIKNAPYSAEVITEKTQALPDGNQISKRTSALTFRDSAGRTRQETRDAQGNVKTIHINDGVEGNRYVLSPSSKTATKISIEKDLSKRIVEIKEKAKAMAKDGNVRVIEQSGPGQEIIVKRVVTPGTDGRTEIGEEVRVKVMRAGGDAKLHFDDADVIKLPGKVAEHRAMAMSDGFSSSSMLGNVFQDAKWSSKSSTSQLGSKDMEGVRAEGKSVSYTIPAGEIGNRNPITVTNETWYSPDLQATVYAKSSDPRVGETVYRLTNLKRTEQATSLFTVPEGYSLKEMPSLSMSAKQK
jgi:YD repeat-containing protein